MFLFPRSVSDAITAAGKKLFDDATPTDPLAATQTPSAAISPVDQIKDLLVGGGGVGAPYSPPPSASSASGIPIQCVEVGSELSGAVAKSVSPAPVALFTHNPYAFHSVIPPTPPAVLDCAKSKSKSSASSWDEVKDEIFQNLHITSTEEKKEVPISSGVAVAEKESSAEGFEKPVVAETFYEMPQIEQQPYGDYGSGFGNRFQKRKPKSEIICLDYLKGLCEQKRWKCKYAHPPLNLARPAANNTSNPTAASEEICEVWMLTGYCKFGDKCRNAHPPLEECGPYSGICAAPITAKTQQQFEQPEIETEAATTASLTLSSATIGTSASMAMAFPTAVALKNSAETVDASKLMAPPKASELDPAMRKVCGILNKLAPDRFDKLAQDLFLLLCDPSANGLLPKVILLIFSRAVNEEQQSAVYASLCRRLFWWIPSFQRAELCTQLMDLVTTLDNAPLNEANKGSLRTRRLGNVVFLNHLLKEELVTEFQIFEFLVSMIQRAGKATSPNASSDDGSDQIDEEEAAFSIEVAIKLLSLVTDRLDFLGTGAVDQLLYQLQVVSYPRPQRIQLLVSNALTLRTRKQQQQQQQPTYTWSSQASSATGYPTYQNNTFQNGSNFTRPTAAYSGAHQAFY